jgi:hypothetical protein
VEHEYSWGDVAEVRHNETALVVTDQQGESATIRLLERIRLQVRAPVNLTRQIRVGRVRLTPAEWTYATLVTVGAAAVATLRTLSL